MNKHLIIILPLLLSGCSKIYDMADGIGKHMPTIGEPCRNWQCVTTHGKQQSDQEKWAEEVSERKQFPSEEAKANSSSQNPSNGEQ